jgi:hypothetical protein
MAQPRICPSCHCSFHQDFVCTTCGAEKLYDATLRALQAENAELWKDAERSVSWIDGVIEILELYRPETPSQKEWQKRMVGEGYAIIQAHVNRAMKEAQS